MKRTHAARSSDIFKSRAYLLHVYNALHVQQYIDTDMVGGRARLMMRWEMCNPCDHGSCPQQGAYERTDDMLCLLLVTVKGPSPSWV